MTTESNKPGPTTLWKTLKGKNVKTNDGKDLGEIKDISDNYIILIPQPTSHGIECTGCSYSIGC